MAIKNRSFYQENTIDVTVEVNNEILHGKLQFGGFRIPSFRLQNYSSSAASAFFAHAFDINELTCTSLNGGETYTLHKTKIREGTVLADFITEGKQQSHFDTFELHLTGISVWIEGQRGLNINGDCIERHYNTETISEPFHFDSNNYNLSTTHRIETHSETPVEGHFNIDHTLVIRKTEGFFTFEECRKVSHELRNLFSLLVGNSLSVKEVWIFNHEDPARYRWIYFLTVLYAQEPLRHSFDSLSSFSELTQERKWAELLSNYFSKDIFRTIWNRLVPSYGKMGAWEYDILSRVVILEMYSGVKTTKKKMKLEKRINSDFIKEITNTIDRFASSRNISGTNQIVFEGMKKSILATRNTSLPTLKEKYEALMEEISPPLKDAISFTDDDFWRIKKLRDSIAHGFDYDRHNSGDDITHEMQLNDRLLVLLMCFAYLELGLKENEIASSLLHSHCRFIGNAGLNKRELSRISGDAIFITLVAPPKSLQLRSYESIVLNHSIETDTWQLNEELTDKLRTEWFKSGIPVSVDYIRSIAPEKEGQTFELIQRAYIECEGIETEHYLIVLINA